MDVLSIEKNVILVYSSPQKTITALRQFLKKNNFNILFEEPGDKNFIIQAEGTLKNSLCGLYRQVINFKIRSEQDNVSEISFFFQLPQSIRQWFYPLLTALFISSIYTLFLDLSMVCGFLFIAFIMLLALWLNSNQHKFFSALFSDFFDASGSQVTLVKRAANIPDFLSFIFSFFLMIVFFFFMYVANIKYFYKVLSPPLTAIIFLLVLFLGASMIAYVVGFKSFRKVTFFVPHLGVVTFLIMYSVPSFLTPSFWYAVLVKGTVFGLMIGMFFLFYLCVILWWAVNAAVAGINIITRPTTHTHDAFFRDCISNEHATELLFIGFWLVSSLMILKMALFSANCIHFFISGDVKFLLDIYASDINSSHIAGLRILFGLAGLFFIFLYFPFFVKRITLIKDINRIRTQEKVPFNVIETINSVCLEMRIKCPILLIDDNVQLETQYILGVGMVLWLPKKTLKRLKYEHLVAIFAHEMYHVKKHNFIFSMLCELSEWTLFGKGFLVFSLNTHQIEYDADAFAVKYLKAHNLSKDALSKALHIISIESFIERDKSGARGLRFLLINTERERPDERKISFTDKLNIFLRFYYGDAVLTYLHPTIEQRNQNMEQL